MRQFNSTERKQFNRQQNFVLYFLISPQPSSRTIYVDVVYFQYTLNILNFKSNQIAPLPLPLPFPLPFSCESASARTWIWGNVISTLFYSIIMDVFPLRTWRWLARVPEGLRSKPIYVDALYNNTQSKVYTDEIRRKEQLKMGWLWAITREAIDIGITPYIYNKSL